MLRLLVRCFSNKTLNNDGPHAHNITDVSLPDSFACPLSGCPLSFHPLASPQDHLVCAHFPWLSPPPRPKHGKAHSAAVRESGGDSGAGCGSDVRPSRTGVHKDAFHPRESRQQLSEGSAGGRHATQQGGSSYKGKRSSTSEDSNGVHVRPSQLKDSIRAARDQQLQNRSAEVEGHDDWLVSLCSLPRARYV